MLGLVTAVLFIPLLEGISELILSGFEVIKGYFALRISQYNGEIQKIQMPSSTGEKHVIGFAISEEEGDYEDEDI